MDLKYTLKMKNKKKPTIVTFYEAFFNLTYMEFSTAI